MLVENLFFPLYSSPYWHQKSNPISSPAPSLTFSFIKQRQFWSSVWTILRQEIYRSNIIIPWLDCNWMQNHRCLHLNNIRIIFTQCTKSLLQQTYVYLPGECRQHCAGGKLRVPLRSLLTLIVEVQSSYILRNMSKGSVLWSNTFVAIHTNQGFFKLFRWKDKQQPGEETCGNTKLPCAWLWVWVT